MTTKKLTEKQKLVLETIENYTNENGERPTVKKVAEILGYKSTTIVKDHIKKLVINGYIDKELEMKDSISEKQKYILETIENYINLYGYSPTVRELCNLLKLKSTSTMHGHLDRLERDGYITKVNGEPRTIRVLKVI